MKEKAKIEFFAPPSGWKQEDPEANFSQELPVKRDDLLAGGSGDVVAPSLHEDSTSG